jgi:dTDP-4-dehydrorhamnose 3,5-epimerase-like enzyme
VINTITKVYNHKQPDEFPVAYNDPSIPYNWDMQLR